MRHLVLGNGGFSELLMCGSPSARTLSLAKPLVDEPEPLSQFAGQFGGLAGAVDGEDGQVHSASLGEQLGVPQLVTGKSVGERAGLVEKGQTGRASNKPISSRRDVRPIASAAPRG